MSDANPNKPDRDLEELAKQVSTFGRCPIDVLPDGVVSSGHQRFAAARDVMQQKTIDVRIPRQKPT